MKILERYLAGIIRREPIGVHVEESDVAILSDLPPSSVVSPDLLADFRFQRLNLRAARVDQWRLTESQHEQTTLNRAPEAGRILLCSSPLEAAHIARGAYERGTPIYHTGSLLFGNRLLKQDVKRISSGLAGCLFYLDLGLWSFLQMMPGLLAPQALYPSLSLLIADADSHVQLISSDPIRGERTPPRIVVSDVHSLDRGRTYTLTPSYKEFMATCMLITGHEVLYARLHDRRRTPLDGTHVEELAERLLLERLDESSTIVLVRPWSGQEHRRQQVSSEMQFWYVKELSNQPVSVE